MLEPFFCLKFQKIHAHIIPTGPFANGPRASIKAMESEQLVDISGKKQDQGLTLRISFREKPNCKPLWARDSLHFI